MKKRIAFILAVAMLLSMAPMAAFAADKVSVTFDDKAVVFADAQPFTDQNSRALLPLSPVALAMGLTVDWDNEKEVATFTKAYTAANSPVAVTGDKGYYMGKETVVFTIGQMEAMHTLYFYDAKDADMKTPLEEMTVANKVTMDTVAIVQNQRTYAPVKYLAETLGYKIGWDEKTMTVSLMTNPMAGDKVSVYTKGIDEKTVAISLFEGRFFPQADAKSVEVTAAKVDGKTATTAKLTDEQMAMVKEGMTANYLNGVAVAGTFKAETTYKIMLTCQLTKEDGTKSSMDYAVEYTAPKAETATTPAVTTTPAATVTDSAVKTTDSAVKTTDSAVNTTDSAVKTTDSAVKTTDSAVK